MNKTAPNEQLGKVSNYDIFMEDGLESIIKQIEDRGKEIVDKHMESNSDSHNDDDISLKLISTVIR